MKQTSRLFSLIVIAALFLGACNLPSAGQQSEGNTSGTAAAQTVEAMLSATPGVIQVLPSNTPAPVVVPATLTPVPLPVNTNTPLATATSNCPVAQFVSDVTIPDGTIMTPSQAFNKKWRIKNIGSCAWSGYSLTFDSGDSMGAPASSAITDVGPGQEIDLSVNLTAPASSGSYRGYFRITTNGGVLVPVVNGSGGKTFYVDIKVQTSTAAAFAVTSISYSAGTFTEGSYVNCPVINASITANGPGDVTYIWYHSGSAGATKTLHFDAAGTKSAEPDKWYVGPAAPGPLWVSIYVDTPNHQDFSHLTISPCTGYP